MKSTLFLTLLTSLLLSVNGCATSATKTTFNPDSVFYVSPGGVWIENAIYEVGDGTMKHTGRMWLPPGTMIGSQ